MSAPATKALEPAPVMITERISGVLVNFIHSIVEFCKHCRIERIEFIGPVDGNGKYAIFDMVEQGSEISLHSSWFMQI